MYTFGTKNAEFPVQVLITSKYILCVSAGVKFQRKSSKLSDFSDVKNYYSKIILFLAELMLSGSFIGSFIVPIFITINIQDCYCRRMESLNDF